MFNKLRLRNGVKRMQKNRLFILCAIVCLVCIFSVQAHDQNLTVYQMNKTIADTYCERFWEGAQDNLIETVYVTPQCPENKTTYVDKIDELEKDVVLNTWLMRLWLTGLVCMGVVLTIFNRKIKGEKR